MWLSQVEVREDNTLSIEWYASTPDIDRYNSIIETDGFNEWLKNYLTNPIILLGHNDSKPIGNMAEYSLDNSGLWIRALLTKDTDGVFSDIKEGRTKGFSIGFVPLAWYYKDKVSGKNLKDMTEAEYNNVNYNDIVRVINKIDLVEISVVNIPANPNALFTISKSVRAFFDAIETRNSIEYERRMLIKNENNPFVDRNVQVDIPGEETTPTTDTETTTTDNDIATDTPADKADAIVETVPETPATTDVVTEVTDPAPAEVVETDKPGDVPTDPIKTDAENAENIVQTDTADNGDGAETPTGAEIVQPSQEVETLSTKLSEANKAIDDLLGYCEDLVSKNKLLEEKLNLTPVNRPAVINSRNADTKNDPLVTSLRNAKATAMEL